MFGAGRDQPGVLFELKAEHAIDVADPQQVSRMRNLIWWANYNRTFEINLTCDMFDRKTGLSCMRPTRLLPPSVRYTRS